jgi:hypothetical protein
MDRLLLSCGVITAAFFIAMDVAAATLFYPGYDYAAQQVSELSAIGAPSRPFWMQMSYPYAALMIAFGAGVWSAAAGRSGLRVTAVLIMLFAVTGLAWAQFAPMHMRATEFTGTDVAHIAFAVAAVLLILLFIGFGAAALGRGFRIYSAVTIAAVLTAGGIVGTQIPAIAAGEPTPWMGLLERVSIYGPLLWMAIFALALLRIRRGFRYSPIT